MKRSMKAEVEVTIRESAWLTDLPDLDALAKNAALAAFDVTDHAGASGVAELSIVLADDGFVQTLNREYRNADKPTNVLAFATEEDACDGRPWLMGDVVIAREYVLAEARAAEKSLADHVSHLVVHGVLHLAGHDHLAEREAEEMEALERRALAHLGIADPYAERERCAATHSHNGMQAE